MKRENLKVEKRKILGKKVKQLRKDGILPANVYGKDFKSISVQVALKDFEAVYKEAGETGVVDLQVDSQSIPVLIHHVDKDYLSNPLHAEFYKVNLTEKVKTMVPLEIIGEPKAVVDKVGLLMNITNEVEVEALPTELPENIEVNVENLASIDEQIIISDLKVPQGVEVLTDPNQVVVKIGELVSKEAQEQAAEEAAAAEAAAAEGGAEGEEGAKPTEGETSEGGEKKEEAGEKPQEEPKQES